MFIIFIGTTAFRSSLTQPPKPKARTQLDLTKSLKNQSEKKTVRILEEEKSPRATKSHKNVTKSSTNVARSSSSIAKQSSSKSSKSNDAKSSPYSRVIKSYGMICFDGLVFMYCMDWYFDIVITCPFPG